MSMRARARNYALLAVAGMLSVAPARAGVPDLPPLCAAAEMDAAEKLRDLLLRSDGRATWLMISTMALLKTARGYCVNGDVDRALPFYQRMYDAFAADDRARSPEVAAREGDGPLD